MQIDFTQQEIDLIANLLISELIDREYLRNNRFLRETAFDNEVRITELNQMLDKLIQVIQDHKSNSH